MDVLEFLINNMGLIRDLSYVLLAITGTTIAILTYRRARATILEPMRNEVIKKQSVILTNLLNTISQKDFDYAGLFKLNVNDLLVRYGFVSKDQKNIIKYLDENMVGGLLMSNGENLEEIEKIEPFIKKRGTNKELKKKKMKTGKDKLEELKRGVINIQIIHTNKSYNEFSNQISEFADNPFLPAKIREILERVLHESHDNLRIHMKSVLEKFMKDFIIMYYSEKKKPIVSSDGVYNKFNSIRIDHEPTIKQLKEEINSYLHIDEKW